MKHQTLSTFLLTLAASVSVSVSVAPASAQELPVFKFGTAVTPEGKTFHVDSKGFIDDGHRVIPVMGEIHYSRLPERDWKREVEKMKAGGIDIVACYVFWNHHEDKEGVFEWGGNLNLRKFLETCKACQQKVVLRVGPFCHGETYLGGIPEWMVDKAMADPAHYKLRTLAPGFIEAVSRWYKEIGRQAEGLLWKDGGPVIGLQVDNESRGPWPYLATLKQAAIDAGFDLPFYTRTGWPAMNGPAVFGEILPLYGDYADGFWDRELTDMPGSYRDAFHFRDSRLSAVIATEVFGSGQSTEMKREDLAYPYLTCELGGGMSPSYSRRIRIFDRDALALAICKLGSGSNLPGFYMYHGGTNPYCAEHPMAELQNSKYTAWNDLPNVTYDYQSPLGEMGQPNLSYHYLRLLSQMLRDWGDELSLMDPIFHRRPLRCAERRLGQKGFLFVNNYERLAVLPSDTLSFFGQEITVPSGVCFCFPYGLEFNGHTLDWATAQPFCKAGNTLYFTAIEGIEARISIDGKVYAPAPDRCVKVGGDIRLFVMSPEKSLQAYKVSDTEVRFSDGILYRSDGKIVKEKWVEEGPVAFRRIKEAGPAREIRNGRAGVPEQPSEAEYAAAAQWTFSLPKLKNPDDWFLRVDYLGDVARVEADGIVVEDNFWNGRPMLVRVSDLVGKEVSLSILPMRKDTPVYLQPDERRILHDRPGDLMLELSGITLVHRLTR